MAEIGVRELKAHASEIVRSVRDIRARYIITHRGKPVALLIPVDESREASPALDVEPPSAAWDELIRLGEEIGREWRSPLTSTEILSEIRR